MSTSVLEYIIYEFEDYHDFIDGFKKKLLGLYCVIPFTHKGGLGNLTTRLSEKREIHTWARDNSDRFREELNEIINTLDQIIGN